MNREKYQEALEKIIDNYKSLIKNPNEFPKWTGYGQYRNCRFCEISEVKTEDDVLAGKCKECPLSNEDDVYKDISGIIPSCANNDSYTTFYMIINSAWVQGKGDIDTIKTYAKMRLQFIKMLAKKNNYQISNKEKKQ